MNCPRCRKETSAINKELGVYNCKYCELTFNVYEKDSDITITREQGCVNIKKN